jgi:hypothetical protein
LRIIKTSNAACGEAAIGKLCGTAGTLLFQEAACRKKSRPFPGG